MRPRSLSGDNGIGNLAERRAGQGRQFDAPRFGLLRFFSRHDAIELQSLRRAEIQRFHFGRGHLRKHREIGMGFRVRGIETQRFLPRRVCLLVTLLMGIGHSKTKMRFGMFRGVAQRRLKRLFRLLPLFLLKMRNAPVQIREGVAGFQARHLFPRSKRGFPLPQSAQGNGLFEPSGRVFGIGL